MLLDVSLPLCRGQLISTENGKSTWITFKYELLLNICCWCGKLDHDDRDCMLWLESEGTLSEDQKQFSPKLRASPFVPSRKAVLSVPGFYKMKLGVSLKSGVHEVGSRTESMKVNHKAQAMAHGPAAAHNTENPRDAMSEQLMDEAINLDAPKVTHIVGKSKVGVINVSLSTPQFSGNHNTENQGADFSAKEFDARINEIDSKMGKFDHINCMTQPRNISQDILILSKACEKHVLVKPQST